MRLINDLNKLSKDYKLILKAAIIAFSLALLVFQLPVWITEHAFWVTGFGISGLLIIGFIAQLYYYSTKLTRR